PRRPRIIGLRCFLALYFLLEGGLLAAARRARRLLFLLDLFLWTRPRVKDLHLVGFFRPLFLAFTRFGETDQVANAPEQTPINEKADGAGRCGQQEGRAERAKDACIQQAAAERQQ